MTLPVSAKNLDEAIFTLHPHKLSRGETSTEGAKCPMHGQNIQWAKQLCDTAFYIVFGWQAQTVKQQ